MCGICGVYSTKSTPDRDRLLKMREIMRHRGPDDCGIFVNEEIGLAMRRLSVIDLYTGQQPMSNEDDSIVIVLNGEIYNYIELRNNSLKNKHQFKTKSDTEVILHLYEDYGPDCVKYLNGMFAFALWDKRKKLLMIARDPFGIKPLYYKSDPGNREFIFASEIKSILTYQRSRATLNVTALYDYLTFQYVLGEKTLFEGISKLMPGHYMLLSEERPEGKNVKYWDVENSYDFNRSEDDFADELCSLLEDSVRIQLRSDVPLGAHLSGGVDTGALTSIASGLLDGNGKSASGFKTFTAGFKEGGIYDDREFAGITSSFCKSDHIVAYPTADDFEREFTRLMWFLDEPVAAPGLFPQYFVSKLAKENVTVVLGGQGSDEMLGGYTRYLILYLEQALKKSIAGSSNYDLHIPLKDLLPNLPQLNKYQPLMSYFFKEGLFGEPDERYFRLILRNERIPELLSPEIQEMAKGYNPFDTFREIFNAVPEFELLNKVLYYEMKAWLPALLQVEDRMSMAWSLESRVPFLDTRIAELAFSMPSNIKFKGGITKYILRKALKGKLPESILWRQDKLGFPVPLKQWFKKELKPFLKDKMLNNTALNRNIFRKESIESQLSENQESEFDRTLWGMLCMETWFSIFLDGDGSFFD